MDEGALLTLDEAATRTGYRKRELRALVREGRLPAVRAGKRWQVAAADLSMLPSRIAAPPEPEPPPVADLPAGKSSDPMMALIELLRERDQKLTELLEERSQLTGQVGFLLGQLSEREERIQRLEQAMLSDRARHSVHSLPGQTAPVALIDEWAKTATLDTNGNEVGATVKSLDDPKRVLSALPNPRIEGNDIAPVVGPDSPMLPEPPAAPADMSPQPKRGLFGLFRRRAPG